MSCFLFHFALASAHAGIDEEQTYKQDDGEVAECGVHIDVVKHGIDEHGQAEHVESDDAPSGKSLLAFLQQVGLHLIKLKEAERQRDDADGEQFHDGEQVELGFCAAFESVVGHEVCLARQDDNCYDGNVAPENDHQHSLYFVQVVSLL